MCDVIEICLRRRYATRNGKENQPLNIKKAAERPILKLGLPNFSWSFYLILLLVDEIYNSKERKGKSKLKKGIRRNKTLNVKDTTNKTNRHTDTITKHVVKLLVFFNDN